MPLPVWRIDGDFARLDLPHLTATIDSGQPVRGLTEVKVHGIAWDAARLLGVGGTALEHCAETLVEWHVRGDELMASYEVGPPHAARVDLVWRATSPAGDEPWLACIDLQVSLRTDQLDWRHDVYIEGEMPQVIVAEELSSATGCWIFRSEHWSYAEFVHPADLRRDELATSGFLLRRHLFATDCLEKGVILRARARGLILPANVSSESVIQCYNRFVAAEPPINA